VSNINQSKFVNVFAWIFIVFAGWGVFIGFIQLVAYGVVFPAEQVKELMNDPEVAGSMPEYLQYLITHMHILALIVFLMTVGVFVSSVGLLKRKNWARRIFIGFMILGIITMFVSAGFQLWIMPSAQDLAPENQIQNYEAILWVMRLLALAILFIFTLLYGWIIKKLISPEVKREFLPV